jgi:hypothetical protein
MKTFLTRAAIVLSALLIAATVSAQTQGLERVGPNSTTHGYPTWYQDKTGLTLEFCTPLNQGELDGGWCLLLPGDTIAPEVFPSPFFDEHFYFAAGANTTGAIVARLDLAIEGAFRVGPVIDGDQITFARIRFVFDAPAAGTYTIRHPYGTDTVTVATAGDRVFVTEDVGIDCAPGAFDCALRGRIGPFLLPSSVPGGTEQAAILGPVAGKLYIADPARLGPVTGSPVGQNLFSVAGPGTLFAQTNDFALMGRVYQGTMPGRMTVDRARYARASGSAAGITDVFATAFATAQPRLPAAPITGIVTPMLGFYPAACSVGTGGVLGAPAGVSAVQMFATDTRFYGQYPTTGSPGPIPPAVCVQDYTARDANGQAIPSFAQKAVTDQVTVLQAMYDPASGDGSLTVGAVSSDQNLLPVLTASLVGAMANQPDGTATVTAAVGVPPVRISVTSAAGGHAELEVSSMVGQPALPDVPFAGNDAFTLNEDSGLLSLNVLVNDTMGGVVITSGAIAITQPPGLGTAVVNTTTGAIDYTPALNKNGSDLLMYTVSVAGQTSPPAFVSITITPENDAPVANNDAGSGVGGLGFSINLLANDTDVDGQADLVGVNIVSAPAGLTYTLVGGNLSFTAAAGTYVFTYQASDVAGAPSNVATATVTLTAGDVLTITRAEYIQNKRRWRITGTASNPAGQTVYVSYANGTFATGATAVGTLVGSAIVDALGAWVLDFALAGTNDPRNPTSTLFSVRPTQVYATSTLGGRSPNFPIAIK